MPLEQRGGGRRGRRDRDGGRGKERDRVTFLAVLSKPGLPDKRFTIAKDRSRKEWTCGNGTLMRDESGVEILHWQAGDGRVSTWSREGCVYFDAPPSQQGPPEGDMMVGPNWMEPTMPMIFTLVPSEAGAPMGWEEQSSEAVMDTDSVLEAMHLPRPALPVLPEAESAEGTTMRASAPEFVPTTAAARASLAQGAEASDAASSDGDGAPTSAPSTGVPVTPQQRYQRTPTQSPLLGPQVAPPLTAPPYRSRASPKMGPAPASHSRGSSDLIQRQQRGRTPAGTPQCSPQLNPLSPPTGQTAPPSSIELSEDAENVQAFGSRLEWAIPETWGKLSRLPQDFSVTSSMFGIQHCPNMQLAFYPNGNRAAEPGHCTVALTRGPQCAGIKFEFLVNGRGIGPKVCLGRRYLGDYPKPYDESDASKPQKVVVCMQVLEVLGAPAD